MASKYDAFWRTRLKPIAGLVEEAHMTGKSQPLDVSDLQKIGNRKSWYGTACVTASGKTCGGDMVHAKSLADAVIEHGLLRQYRHTEFRMTISQDLKLTISRESLDESATASPVALGRPQQISSISDLPTVPAVYALHGGKGPGRYIAYVGISNNLKSRIEQHLIRRDSSVTTGASAAILNPDYVTEISWWEHSFFEDRVKLEAAELLAIDVLDPSLRSRGIPRRESVFLLGDTSFAEAMHKLLASPPNGHLTLPNLVTALERIDSLERRIAELEERIK